jgi:hypothetical protein
MLLLTLDENILLKYFEYILDPSFYKRITEKTLMRLPENYLIISNHTLSSLILNP